MERASSETSPIVLYDAVVRLLGTAGSPATLVVLLDDLHWADDATIELFGFIARARPHGRLLLVGLARPDLASGHPLRALAPELVTQPQVNRITLAGLDDDEVGELIERTTGSSADRRLAAVLRERTGGNPFFIREILRGAIDDNGQLDLSLVAVPGSVRDVTRSRARPAVRPSVRPRGTTVLGGVGAAGRVRRRGLCARRRRLGAAGGEQRPRRHPTEQPEHPATVDQRAEVVDEAAVLLGQRVAVGVDPAGVGRECGCGHGTRVGHAPDRGPEGRCGRPVSGPVSDDR